MHVVLVQSPPRVTLQLHRWAPGYGWDMATCVHSSSISGPQLIFHIITLSCACACSVPYSCLTLCNPWTIAHQAPLSVRFSRQEYWSELPCPPPGDLPDPGIKPTFPVSPALAGGFFTMELCRKPTTLSLKAHPVAYLQGLD